MKRTLFITLLALLTIAALPTLGTAADKFKNVIVSNTDAEPVPTRAIGTTNVGGTVNVGNLPATQAVTGTVGLDPAANAVTLAGRQDVGILIPARPIYLDYSLISGEDEEVESVSGTRVGVSSVTVTNRSDNPIGVTVFNSITSGVGCTGNIIGGGAPRLQLELAPHSTLHNDYPTPLVFRPLESDTPVCFAVDVQGAHAPEVRVGINGFVED